MRDDFDPDDRAAILAALNSDNPDHPIARAIAVRLEALTKALEEAAAASGSLPDRIEVTKPRTALDAVAIELFRASLDDVADAPAVVVLEYGRQ